MSDVGSPHDLDVETLEVTGDTFVDPELRLHVSDLVCRVARRGGGEDQIFGLKAQTGGPAGAFRRPGGGAG
ncbi:MAG TPA: hypothetical protein VLH75_08275 [Longimicrobiales bacterium]|nr:hypothetical protein [Longimicrobiales bacterium]